MTIWGSCESATNSNLLVMTTGISVNQDQRGSLEKSLLYGKSKGISMRPYLSHYHVIHSTQGVNL